MSVVTEILDRIPSPDGGLRRRFTSGILFMMIALTGVFWFPGFHDVSDPIAQSLEGSGLGWAQLNATGVLIILFSVVFVLGNLIDVFAYVFLNRLFFFAGSTIAYRGLQTSFRSIRGLDPADSIALSTTERQTYDQLPDFVQEGLRNPYKRQFEVAFRYLVHIAPDDEKAWLSRIDSRNQNLFAVISSTFVGTLLILAIAVTQFDNATGGGAAEIMGSLLVFGGLAFAIMIPLSFVYALMLRFSITSALEMLWLRKGVVGGTEDFESDGTPSGTMSKEPPSEV